MTHAIEVAASGRARCRGCGRTITKGELRFGERHPNAFGDGDMTLWFHLRCAAFKRPQELLGVIETAPPAELPELKAIVEHGLRHRRLPRVNGAERAPTGRAHCRCCRELIELESWRIGLVFFEEFRFEPSGFVHAHCAREYFETVDLLDRVRWFSPELTAEDVAGLAQALAQQAPSPGAADANAG